MNPVLVALVVTSMDPFASAGTLEVAGLPLHPLIVHAVVILTPLTVLAVLLGAVWPAARRRLGILTPLAALVVLILVPITVAAGEALKQLVGPVQGVQRHEELGRMLLPWAIGLFAVAVLQWLWFSVLLPRRDAERAGASRAIGVVLGVLAAGVGAGTLVVLVLIGDSGARAVWGGLIG